MNRCGDAPTTNRKCVCGHLRDAHGVRCGTRLPSGWVDVTDYPGACKCPGFRDAAAIPDGGRPVFGIHRQEEPWA